MSDKSMFEHVKPQAAPEKRRVALIELPDFDELVRLYKTDPTAFEQLRRDLCEQLIESAPERMRQRLRGIQFKVDMTRRKARTPLSACLSLSKMMQESLMELQAALNNPGEFLRQRTPTEATVLPFCRPI
jgi:hypothetical protein